MNTNDDIAFTRTTKPKPPDGKIVERELLEFWGDALFGYRKRPRFAWLCSVRIKGEPDSRVLILRRIWLTWYETAWEFICRGEYGNAIGSIWERIAGKVNWRGIMHRLWLCPRTCRICQNERDWPEDFAHENGQYSCGCVYCGSHFIGHKRRVVCRRCHKRYARR
jgi:hypothetical protein